jgi:hypothetical protein
MSTTARFFGLCPQIIIIIIIIITNMDFVVWPSNIGIRKYHMAMFPLIFIISVRKKCLVSTEIAINARQAADFILLLQIMISGNINVYDIRVLIIIL